MGNGLMYEGDGYLRKGPTPDEVKGKEARAKNAAPEKASKARGGNGITWFRITRLVFGR